MSMPKNNHGANFDAVEFIKIESYKDHGKIFLRVECVAKDKYRKVRMQFPKVKFPIKGMQVREEVPSINRAYKSCFLNFDIPNDYLEDCLEILPPSSGELYTVRVLEEYPVEMTLEEIEKALGHKIKIVTEKEN